MRNKNDKTLQKNFATTWWAKKKGRFLITWVSLNGFQCAIPYSKALLMRFKIRYKVLHNYFPIIFYRSNCFGLSF